MVNDCKACKAFATALVGLPWLPWPMINAVFGSNSGLLLQEREDGCSFHISQTVNRVSWGRLGPCQICQDKLVLA